MSKSFEITNLMDYMKDFLKKQGSDADLSDFDETTDLVALGVHSIVILELIAELESHFKKQLTLSMLEHHDYKISAQSLFSISE